MKMPSQTLPGLFLARVGGRIEAKRLRVLFPKLLYPHARQ